MLAQIVLFDGFDPLDVIAPYEVLYAGGMVAGGALNVELVSAEGAREVPSGTGPVSLRATARLDGLQPPNRLRDGQRRRVAQRTDAGGLRLRAHAVRGGGGQPARRVGL